MMGVDKVHIKAGVDTLLILKVTQAPLFRFLLVGASAFVLDAGVVWGLTHIGLGPYAARAISLCVSVAFTFVLNRFGTFGVTGKITFNEVTVYVGASALGMVINYGVYAGALKLGLMWLPAMVLGTVIASSFNFFAYGRIFKKV
jgi:putative flippase GtrA